MKRKPTKRTETWTADEGEMLAQDLQWKLRDADAIPEDAGDCIEEVRACLSGEYGKAAMKAFTRTLQRLMTEYELEERAPVTPFPQSARPALTLVVNNDHDGTA